VTGRLPGRRDGEAALDGRVVPVYAVTSGRTHSLGRDLPVESLVTATDRWPDGLEKEYRVIVERATRPASLVEVAAWIGVPFGVARVLVGDLADAGYLEVHVPPPATPDGTPRPEHLIRLLEGLRAR
jgi:hypothetical protein